MCDHPVSHQFIFFASKGWTAKVVLARTPLLSFLFYHGQRVSLPCFLLFLVLCFLVLFIWFFSIICLWLFLGGIYLVFISCILGIVRILSVFRALTLCFFSGLGPLWMKPDFFNNKKIKCVINPYVSVFYGKIKFYWFVYIEYKIMMVKYIYWICFIFGWCRHSFGKLLNILANVFLIIRTCAFILTGSDLFTTRSTHCWYLY